MGLEFERRLAVIATNAHIIACRDTTCNVRVGIDDPDSEDGLVWSELVRVVSWVPEKDLAFLEATIPDDAPLRAARLASAECGMDFADRVVSIGWPDLRVRRNWGVTPPPNFTDQVKRHSDGSLLLCLGNYQMRSEDNRLMEPMEVVFHNADVLPGSSGGPVVSRNGDVLGLNTIVLRNDRETERHRFCARRSVNETGQCMHAAIASIELIAEYERIYSSRIALADCSSPSELDARF
jgi:S1-C subfamily serine protease